jgi:hypothetical protein
MHTRSHRSRPSVASRWRIVRSPGGDLGVVKDPEPAPGVVGRIPRHMRERRQCQRRNTVGHRSAILDHGSLPLAVLGQVVGQGAASAAAVPVSQGSSTAPTPGIA